MQPGRPPLHPVTAEPASAAGVSSFVASAVLRESLKMARTMPDVAIDQHLAERDWRMQHDA
jgi:hypothetical protein